MNTKIELLPAEFLAQAAECLKVMAHPLRLRIVDVLMQGEFPVSQIAELCQLPHNQACEHLRLMKSHGFLASKRKGREVYYSIASPRLPGLIKCITTNCGIEREIINNINQP